MKKNLKKYYSNFLEEIVNDILDMDIENCEQKQSKELKNKDIKIELLRKKAFNNKSDYNKFLKENL